MQAKTVALILGAGSGTRMGHETPKQFLPLSGKPVLAYTLEVFESCAAIDEIVVVSGADWLDQSREIAERHAPTKLKGVVAGGATRQESSYLGMSALKGHGDETIVLVHDAVRPFVSPEILERCVQAVGEFGAVDVVVPAVDTIVEGEDGFITSIPDRSRMYQGQTPQGFTLGILRQAHEQARSEGFLNSTDDVRLVLRTGRNVRLVMGAYDNMKLTHPDDIALAEQIIAKRKGPVAWR